MLMHGCVQVVQLAIPPCLFKRFEPLQSHSLGNCPQTDQASVVVTEAEVAHIVFFPFVYLVTSAKAFVVVVAIPQNDVAAFPVAVD